MPFHSPKFSMPTKQQEIDILKNFVGSIDPNSYLGDFFQGCVPFFESAIRSDAVFAHADAIRSNEAQLRAVQAEIDAKTKKLREIEEKTAAMESRLHYAERQLQSMKDSSSKLFNEIRSKIDSVEYAVTGK